MMKTETLAAGFSRHPLFVSEARAHAKMMLADPKLKLNRGERKRLMAARSFIIRNDEAAEPRKPAVRLALKLRTLSMYQLGRRMAQFARRAATAKYILEKMTTYSPFRSQVQASQDGNLAAFKQAEAEVDARLLAANGKLAEAVE